ncbi:hypothetical protein BH10BAC3_BH10BAC3_31200 [soil metagenome]
MNQIQLQSFTLIGVALPFKTSNENGRANIDCGSLWQKFEAGNYADKIPGKLTDDIFAVYHDYEGDYTKPYAYFIGCKVKDYTAVPAGLDSLIIAPGNYQPFIAKGKMPDCIADAWQRIWQSNINRAYKTDYEIYTEKSRDWNDAEVDIYVSVK